MSDSCCHNTGSERRRGWLHNKLLWTASGAGLLYLAGFLLPALKPFQEPFTMYLKMVWWALAVGFLLAGMIDRYVPSAYVSHLLARPKKRTILFATGLGVVMSACSHGILAIGIELHKKGASGPAVISFLLGSPWANLPVTLLLISLFHSKGVLILASAIFVSVMTGFIFIGLDRIGWIDRNRETAAVADDFSIRDDLKRRWKERRWNVNGALKDGVAILQGAVSLANMILWWVLLGIVLAALIGAYVPSHIFHEHLGPTLTGLLLTLAAATVIEICSEGSAPLAFEVYRQTGSIGNTFAFLMGGFVTDYTEIGLVWQNLGRRTALWMVAVSVPQVILLGWLYNRFFYP